MKKRIVEIVALVLSLVFCFALVTSASSLLQKIEAYLNHGITVKLNGEEQRMYDANGTRVYPISYQGTTYVPIRAVSNMMGIDVEWDGPNNTVWLGKTDDYKDFIETCLPYSVKNGDHRTNHYKTTDNKSISIGGKTYNNYIVMRTHGEELFYNLEGKYEELSFLTYGDDRDVEVKIWGDNGELLGSKNVKMSYLPEVTTIDVSNVQQLSIQLITGLRGYSSDYLYIVDAKIK